MPDALGFGPRQRALLGFCVCLGLGKVLSFGLTQIAIDGVSEWRFKPATKEGKPVAVVVPIEVTTGIY